MPKPRRLLEATAQLTTTPPHELAAGHVVAKLVTGVGKNLYTVELASKDTLLAELASQFRSSFWMKKGGYVIVDTSALADRENKLGGQIINVVRDEKQWRKMPWWPLEFMKRDLLDSDNDEDGSVKGRLPSSDDEDD